MDKKSLVSRLLRALFWIERSTYFDEVGGPSNLGFDFRATWRLLPHSVKAALIDGLETGLIRFDRSVDPRVMVDPFDAESVRINMGSDHPALLFGYVPGLSKKGFETVTTDLGLSQELTGRREKLYLSDDDSSDDPDWLLDSWNKIKSSPEDSINDIEDQLMHPSNFSKVMIADIIEVEGNDAIERNLTITGELFFAEDISISNLVHQTATAFGLQRIFISDYEGDTAGIGCYSELPFDERRNPSKIDDVFWGGDYFLKELVLDQETPFAYCVKNEDLKRYKCLEITNGTGTQVDPGKWIGEKKEYVWPSSIYPDPLIAITSRPDLVKPLSDKDSINVAAVFTENEWADAIEQGEFERLREIVRKHHEFGQRTFDELVLSDADIDETIDGFGSAPGRVWRV